MYTQCPDCATVFRLTAEVLREAQGEVRCGVCATSFNAIENLSERPFKATADDAAAPQPEDSMTVEELPGGEDIELPSVPAPELDPGAVAATLSEPEDTARTDEYPILVLDERDEPEEVVLETAPAAASATGDSPTSGYSAPRILIPEEMRERLAQEAAARSAFATDFGMDEPAAARPRWPWAAAAAVLLLMLSAQMVHGMREALVRQSGIGPLVAQAYELFGRPLSSPTDLTAFELRQWGAANDPSQQGRLLLRASIVNRADFAQPYPLLRLALQDRFGTTLFTRDIEPADYLPGAGASRLLGPGQRADAEIRIVDPGQEAVGFEMDVCLPADGDVRCANQITTAAQ